MKINIKVMVFVLAMLLSFLPMTTVMAANDNSTSDSQMKTYYEIPTVKIIENSDIGAFSAYAEDSNGNVIFSESDIIAESAEEVIMYVYNTIFGAQTKIASTSSCTHIPCNHVKVQGAINHIINESTGICTMVRSQYYQCACCSAIIGIVPDSTVVVGTHPAH